MLKIIALPDLHGKIDMLPKIAAALAAVDLVLLPGDLTNGGKTGAVTQVVETVRQHNPRVLTVPGNWDGGAVQTYLAEQQINLHGCHQVVDGIAFLGVGGSLRSHRRTLNELTEEQIEEVLRAGMNDLDPALPKILVAHQPPYGTVNDRAWNGLQIGSQAIRTFIEAFQPLLCFTGHVHEGMGIDAIGQTQIINPGPLWLGSYAYAEVDQGVQVLEIRRC